MASIAPEAALDWSTARTVALRRDCHRCVECGEAEYASLDVHHRVPRSAGGGNEASNLTTLCDGCHARRHPNLQVSLSRRAIERWALRLARWLDTQRALPDEIESLSAALRIFGKERLREGQLEAVLAALRGEDVLVVRPTGSGKTLCFQLPAVMRDGSTFVLSPLKALMKDQVAELQARKIPGTFINSDLGHDEKKARYELLGDGALKFLYCTPERFGENVRHEELAALGGMRPAFLVVDEAHCVVRWGDAFRPDYSRIAAIRELLGNPPVLAFTATAGVSMQRQIKDSLGVPDARTLVTGADRPNIALIRHFVPYDARKSEPEKEREQMVRRAELIARLVRDVRAGKTMIFVPTIKIGTALQLALADQGLNLPFYHSRFGTANERDMIVGRFTGRLEPSLDAVICTNAFSMGLDVPNVRLVINWQHPASVEDYLQEFGRAGRDGAPATAVLLVGGSRDKSLLDWMAEQSLKHAAEAGEMSAQDRIVALSRRKEAIAAMHEIATRPDSCFRTMLLRRLVGESETGTRPTISVRVLNWAFGEKSARFRSDFCCDNCDRERSQAFIGDAAPTRMPGRVPAR
ncbi:MAG TPA: RecQ family ATP-dependent DNA helicase [Gaiellaceae bacterium]|jgi:ATP-dependent DNA helicase RecQ|nr:RecQ family ATP-dependent DNA helicase [Gaiellaceae bacterium]